jgi:hypothetical protein
VAGGVSVAVGTAGVKLGGIVGTGVSVGVGVAVGKGVVTSTTGSETCVG